MIIVIDLWFIYCALYIQCCVTSATPVIRVRTVELSENKVYLEWGIMQGDPSSLTILHQQGTGDLQPIKENISATVDNMVIHKQFDLSKTNTFAVGAVESGKVIDPGTDEEYHWNKPTGGCCFTYQPL